ncbi:MAG TPA: hypothetical protein VGO62_09440 [Myxococcota bacterium]|jgi:hypothetical protein
MRTRLLVVIVVIVSGCAHMYSKDDLDVSLFQHHNNLRWGRLDNAATTVSPELRTSFLSTWAARQQTLELQDVEVQGATLTPDGAAADVVVAITYVDKASMTVKNVTMIEHWIRTDDGWLEQKFADAPVPPPP